jgi:preprotein translocase subunit YajC
MIGTAHAQTSTTPPSGAPTPGPAAGFLGSPMFMMLLLGALFYFMILAPGNKERKKREEMLKNIQRGDKVLTRGGLWGHVADIRDNQLVLKINENTKVEVERSYVESVEKPST